MTNERDGCETGSVTNRFLIGTLFSSLFQTNREIGYREIRFAKSNMTSVPEFVEIFARIRACVYVLLETMHRANRYSTRTKRSSVITAIPFGASL